MSLGKMSFIMPAYDIAWRSIERAIDSLLDQDYKDWELIIVKNGMVDKGKIRRKVKPYLKDKRIKLVIKKKGGACYARNEGQKVATGDFYSFFSSDFVLKPGMLRKWLEYFRDNEDYGMVYGGYEWTDEATQPFYSQEHDEYLLTRGFNYIDGAMPIRKECYVPWDEDLVSLNDWEWAINLVKNGCKPLFIPEKAYKADLPKAGGLSNDSAKNWTERVKYIKDKHNIPTSKICVSSLGAPNHGIKVAKLLGADFKGFPTFKPNEYEMIYLLGFYCSSPESVKNHMRVFDYTRDKKVKKVIHWIGSDIQGMMGLSWGANRNLVEAFRREDIVHLCECGITKGELHEMGIEAEMIPLPVDIDKYRITPLPKEKVVGIYCPGDNMHCESQYNMILMRDIAESMPDIKFKFFGANKPHTIKNLEYCGFQEDMPKFISECSMVLRVALHDGLPISPIEFMLCGRDALVSLPNMPGTYHIGTGQIIEDNYTQRKEELVADIRKAFKEPRSLKERIDTIRYWREKCSITKYKNAMNNVLRGKSNG